MNWAWLAGFYEGEGHAGLYKHVGSGVSYVVHLSISQADRKVLNKILNFVHGGRIYKQKKGKKRYRQSWSLQFFGKNAKRVAKKILPLMHSEIKIKQLRKAING